MGLVLLGTGNGWSDTIVFEGSTAGITTGELLEGVADTWATNQVYEFAGLELRAKTGDASQALNANNGYFGINSTLSGEREDAFDVGEAMFLAFDQDVRITRIDFNLFDAGETFEIRVGGDDPLLIGFGDLGNQASDYLDFSEGLFIAKDTQVAFSATAGSIGLDSIDVAVIPEPAVAGFIVVAGMGIFATRRLLGVF